MGAHHDAAATLTPRALRDHRDELGVTGSISVAQQLVAADLVDEYRLLIYPVLVGEGDGLLAGSGRLDLDLVEATSFASDRPSSATNVTAEPARRPPGLATHARAACDL